MAGGSLGPMKCQGRQLSADILSGCWETEHKSFAAEQGCPARWAITMIWTGMGRGEL